MRKKILIIVVAAIIIAVPSYYLFLYDESSKTASGDKQLYTCGMHPQIISDEPGLCPICEMRLTPIKKDGSSSGERKILFYRNPMNPNIISDHPQKDEMGMDYVPVYEDEGSSQGVVTIDPAIQQNMNIKTEVVQNNNLSSQVTTNGVLVTNETEQFIVNTRVDGWVEKLYINYTGQKVSKGSKLMDIYSPMLVAAQQELLTALSYQKSMQSSSLDEIMKSSNDLVKNSVKKLELLNMSRMEIENLRNTKEVKTVVTLFAKNSGTVIEKNVIEGQKIMSGEPLLKISNLDNLWLIADVYESEISKVTVGSKASINFTFLPGKTFQGKVNFIYPTLESKSRTIKVRIDLPNRNGDLKPDMFANVVISGPGLKFTPVIPENAVIRGGKKDIVIVDLGNGKFKPQQVILGIYSDGFYQVLSGLTAGNKIVTSAQFLIDSESNLKAAINQFQNSSSDTDNMKQDLMNEMQTGKEIPENKSKQIENKQPEVINESHDHSASIVHKGIIDVNAIDKNGDKKLWECPMDWNVISDAPGRCPECNMKLKEYSIEEIKENLTNNGFKYKK